MVRRMNRRSWMNLSTVLMLAVGCGSKHSEPSKPPAEATKQPAMCAMMKDAQLAATDGEHDMTVTFTTQGDPAELRAHVHKMGAMHDQMAHGMGSGGMGGSGEMNMGSGMGEMHHHMAMVPSHAAVDDVDHGARIVLTPDDPAQLAALRDQVHAHVDMMKSGKCPMMEEHGAADGHHDM